MENEKSNKPLVINYFFVDPIQQAPSDQLFLVDAIQQAPSNPLV